MSSTPLLALVARCRALCRPRSNETDADLLSRFAQQRAAAAFEELLERYAPMVWGVCRRIAPTETDAEDAFQATFLALVRQAGRLHGRQPLGGWLHTIAVRISRKAAARARKQSMRPSLPEPATPGDIADEVGSRELFRMVDEEIEHLPVLLRLPLLMCCLQGRTRDEAAAALGCSVAAVKSRLERGRDLLRRRLQQRGVQLPAAFLVLGLTSERIRAVLWAKTMQSVLYTPAPALVALAEAGLSAMTIGKGKLLLIALLLVSSAAGAAGTLLTEKPAEAPASPQAKSVAAQPKKPEAPQIRTDRHGDPLPEGAIARLGTVRWRHGFMVSRLVYSPDGKTIAAVGGGRALTLWDAATGKEVRGFPNIGQPIGLAFSPDGKMLATTDNPFCYLWDVATGKEIRRLKGHQNVVRGVAFSADGKRVATAGADGTLRLWDPATGKEQRRIDCGAGEVCRLAYSADGKWIASTHMDGITRLWDPASGKEQRQLSGHKKAIWSIVFSPDSQRLASSSDDGTIRLWDVATGRQLRILAENLGEERRIVFSPDGALLAYGCGDGTIRLLGLTDGVEKRRWQAGTLAVRGLAFSPDGKTLASAAAWECIRLWDVATGRERYPSEETRGSINFVRFTPDGANLVSISPDRRMLWWDLTTQMPRRQFTWTAKGFSAIALAPDSNTLAVGSWSDFKAKLWEVRLWDLRTDKPGRLLGKHPGGICPVAFSPDGRLVASGGRGNDNLIHIWDVQKGNEIRQITGVKGETASLCFSPDSKALACSSTRRGNVSSEPGLYLWDVAGGKEQTHFNSRLSDSPYGSPLAFSPDGRVLAASAGYRETSMVRLWNTATGKELCRHTGHGEEVGAIAFSPDGKLVASGSGNFGFRDNSVHVWEAATGRLIRRFEGHHSCVGALDFSSDGLTVASGAGDSTILLWDITGRRSDGRWHAKPLTPRQLNASTQYRK